LPPTTLFSLFQENLVPLAKQSLPFQNKLRLNCSSFGIRTFRSTPNRPIQQNSLPFPTEKTKQKCIIIHLDDKICAFFIISTYKNEEGPPSISFSTLHRDHWLDNVGETKVIRDKYKSDLDYYFKLESVPIFTTHGKHPPPPRFQMRLLWKIKYTIHFCKYFCKTTLTYIYIHTHSHKKTQIYFCFLCLWLWYFLKTMASILVSMIMIFFEDHGYQSWCQWLWYFLEDYDIILTSMIMTMISILVSMIWYFFEDHDINLDVNDYDIFWRTMISSWYQWLWLWYQSWCQWLWYFWRPWYQSWCQWLWYFLKTMISILASMIMIFFWRLMISILASMIMIFFGGLWYQSWYQWLWYFLETMISILASMIMIFLEDYDINLGVNDYDIFLETMISILVSMIMIFCEEPW